MSEQYSNYIKLLDTVKKLTKVEVDIDCDRTNINAFSSFVLGKEKEISIFKKCLEDFLSYLDNYDFEKGFQFETIQNQLKTLFVLREKLVVLGQKVQKLSAYPDRYGSKNLVENCTNLAMAIKDKMSLDEVLKVLNLVETAIKKVNDLLNKFADKNYELELIKELVDSEKALLSKYKYCLYELEKYIEGFPHKEENDLAVVKRQIAELKQFDVLYEDARTCVDTIRGYADRNKKQSVVSQFSTIANELYNKAGFEDLEKYKTKLHEIKALVAIVKTDFEKDEAELKNLRTILLQKHPDIWQEDNEQLLDTVKKILATDTKKAIFDIVSLKDSFSNAIAKRTFDIQNTKSRYSWLNRGKYKKFHDDLISRYISLSEYKSAIRKLRKEKNKKLWKTIGICSGALLVSIIMIVIITNI